MAKIGVQVFSIIYKGMSLYTEKLKSLIRSIQTCFASSNLRQFSIGYKR